MSLTAPSISSVPCCGPDVTGAHLARAQIPSGDEESRQDIRKRQNILWNAETPAMKVDWDKKDRFCLNRVCFVYERNWNECEMEVGVERMWWFLDKKGIYIWQSCVWQMLYPYLYLDQFVCSQGIIPMTTIARSTTSSGATGAQKER